MIELRLRDAALVFDWTLQFARAETAAAYEYWNSCRGARAMPSRSDLKPTEMRKFTEHVGLVEVRHETDGQAGYFIRRAGGKWEEVFGPMTGRYIQEFLPPQIEMRWREALGAVCESKAPVRITTRIQFQQKNWLKAELFIAPLGEEEISMLLTTFVSWSQRDTI